MICYITHDLICYITHDLICYITHDMLCYITHDVLSYTAISRKVVGKMCTRQSREVIWDMFNTLFLTL